MSLQVKSKKGISIMIGYVILITIAVVMGTIVYAWLKSYVPTNVSKCPDGTSIFVKDFTYDCKNSLNVTIQNNGRFSIAGYYIHSADSPTQELATDDLSTYLKTTPNPPYQGVIENAWIKFSSGGVNTLIPEHHINQTFQFPVGTFANPLVFIEITPTMYEEDDKGKIQFYTCSNSRIRQDFIC